MGKDMGLDEAAQTGLDSILKFMLARVRVGQVFRGSLVDGARL
jgi:hypothetical protein